MSFLEENIVWLEEKIQPIKNTGKHFYLIFDLPGQIELYLNHDSIKKVVQKLIKKFDMSACCLEMFDSTYIYDASQFASLCMVSLSTMIHMEMPHINILNKIDVLMIKYVDFERS